MARAAPPRAPLARAAPASAPPWGDTLSPALPRLPGLGWLGRLSGEQRVLVALGALAAVLFVPWLGATGFWDPWEPHYNEVAREMIARGDYLHPWWESTWFFSKPALDLWLMALGQLVARTDGPDRFLGVYTEWGVRLPFAAISALGALFFFVAASRLVSRRAATLAAAALLTSPLTVLLARQAVPDPVFVGLLAAAMSCLALALFDDEAPSRPGWTAAFYVFVGLATLSKGLLGFALPGGVTLLYCLATGEWARLRRLHLLSGALLVLVIAGPWYGTMFAFDGRDDEGKTFFERFIVHDHFKRLALGVHTTTPGGTFVYFLEQLGYDAFPWVFAFPGAAAMLARVRARPASTGERARLFFLLWLLLGFAVFAFSATKFHHYAFPVLPPLLLFSALWLERVLDEGLVAHAGAVLAGGLLYALVAHDLAETPKHLTDLFVYNYDRPYPDREVDPRNLFGALFGAAAALAASPWIADRLTQLGWALSRLWRKAGRAELRRTAAARLSGPPALPDEPLAARRTAVAALAGLALLFALDLGWVHWRRLSPHWSQRDLFWIYAHQSTPDEPIGAYLMNWRGETFYSRNTVRQVGRTALPPFATLADFLDGPGARKWLLVEQGRVSSLRQAVGGRGRLRVVESRMNKFALAVFEPESNPAVPAAPGPAQPPPGNFGAPP